MSSTSRRLLIACFVTSILSLIINLSMVIVRIALKFTGFDMGTIIPPCLFISYLQAKLSSIYLIFRADTIFAGLSLVLAIIIFIYLIKIFIEMRNSQKSEGQQIGFEVPIEKLYLLISFQTLFQIANGGSTLSLQIDNKSCQIVDNSTWIIILIITAAAFLTSLALQIFIIILGICQRKKINDDDIKQNRQVKNEEQEMQRKFQMEAKEYISSNYSQKEEFLKSLTKNQHPIYGQSTRREQQQNTKKQQEQLFINFEEEKNDRYPQVSQDKGAPIRFRNNSVNGYTAEEKQKKIKAEQLAKQKEIQEQILLKDTLFVNNEDDISQKFNQQYFELKEDLSRAIQKDTEEELSPLELKQVMMLTKADFKLTDNDQKAFYLQKKYSTIEGDGQDNYKIRIHFIKIKDHNDNLNISQIQQEKTDLKKLSKIISKSSQESVSQEIKKILKIVMLKNSALINKNDSHVQQECPISRYVQKDDRLEIIQPNSQLFGKNKRIQYSKQQVIFSKKKERIQKQSTQKSKIRHQFNEEQALKMQRQQVMGKDWVRERREQQLNNESIQTRHHKRKVIETIRSKYYQ